jgi:hypothetical protein
MVRRRLDAAPAALGYFAGFSLAHGGEKVNWLGFLPGGRR